MPASEFTKHEVRFPGVVVNRFGDTGAFNDYEHVDPRESDEMQDSGTAELISQLADMGVTHRHGKYYSMTLRLSLAGIHAAHDFVGAFRIAARDDGDYYEARAMGKLEDELQGKLLAAKL